MYFKRVGGFASCQKTPILCFQQVDGFVRNILIFSQTLSHPRSTRPKIEAARARLPVASPPFPNITGISGSQQFPG